MYADCHFDIVVCVVIVVVTVDSSSRTDCNRRILQRKPAIVRAVTSGDSVVLIDVEAKAVNAPPKEINLTLQSLRAPQLGRRMMKNGKVSYEKDEPFAFQSREYLRKRLVGKSVVYTEAHQAGSRSYGELWFREENLRYTIVQQGWADVNYKGIFPLVVRPYRSVVQL